MHADESSAARLGGHLLADALAAQGVDTVFGIPGESYLAVLDGLYTHRDQIRFVICRQEGGAAFMADAYAKLTRKPGVCMVTRGPGATNASIGVHTAYQDSTPMVLLIGQVGRDFAEREAFQEIDYRRMYGQMAKWVAQIEMAERIPEFVARAFQVATSGRMGPVVLALPEDMLTERRVAPPALPHRSVQAAPAPADLAALAARLAQAQRPVAILGGSGWTPQACDDIRAFVEAWSLPTACAFRFQDLLDNAHPNYIGDVGIGINPALAQRIRESDLVLAIGPRLGEMTTSGYTLIDAPVPRQDLVHVHPGNDELGRVYQAALMINSGMPQFAAAAAALPPDAAAVARWRGTVAEARAQYAAWQERPPLYRGRTARLDLWEVVQTCRSTLPHDTIVCNGAGNFATWAHRFWRYGAMRCQLAPTSGAMGYGLPAAIAAAIAAPQRDVLLFAGDGDIQMTVQELATAAQHDAGFVGLIFDNGSYGTIRMHQERTYPGRISGTALVNPDFAALARAYGGLGLTVETTAAFGPALAEARAFARAQRRPALIHLRVDPEDLTPGATASQLREQGMAALARAGGH